MSESDESATSAATRLEDLPVPQLPGLLNSARRARNAQRAKGSGRKREESDGKTVTVSGAFLSVSSATVRVSAARLPAACPDDVRDTVVHGRGVPGVVYRVVQQGGVHQAGYHPPTLGTPPYPGSLPFSGS